MRRIIEKHKNEWKRREFVFSSLLGVLFIIASLFINYFAGSYAAEKASSPVTDIILSNTRAFDVDGIFIYGSIFLFFSVLCLIIYEPRKFPFILKSLALFVLIRSAFIAMTHLGPFPEQVPFEPNRLLEKVTFGGDLFFSGHTGIPFLFALIFWKDKILRYLFLFTSVFFGASVLLGHLHYTIDVFAAFFITYTIFEMSKKFFNKDYKLTLNG